MMVASWLLFCAVVLAGFADIEPLGCIIEKHYSSYGNALYQRLLTAGVFILSLFIAGRQLKNLSSYTGLVLEIISGLLFFVYSSSEAFRFWQILQLRYMMVLPLRAISIPWLRESFLRDIL